MSDATGDRLGKDCTTSTIFGSGPFYAGHFPRCNGNRVSFWSAITFYYLYGPIQVGGNRERAVSWSDCRDRQIFVQSISYEGEDASRGLIRDGIFRPCCSGVWCIEYQKRGLPHMHLLLSGEPPVYYSPKLLTRLSARKSR